MHNKKFKKYLISIVALLKQKAQSAKTTKDTSSPEDAGYNIGYLMALHRVISLMKNQAFAFNIDEKEILLADIEPERDLL